LRRKIHTVLKERAEALKPGYATASTDTGHTGNTAAPLLGHPEKLVDFAYRAVHEMTVTAKAIINAFYNTNPKLSCWNGCSLVFDPLAALEQWVENGHAPGIITASHHTNGKVDRTRPLCPYPQVAKYRGTGSIDEAVNFTCQAP
jgi:feruloyl esterase